MEEDLNLSPEQKQKMEAIRAQGFPQTAEERRLQATKMKEILTPDQISRMQQRMSEGMKRMMGHKLSQAAGVLPPDQYRAFERKMNSRFQEMQERMKSGEMPFPPPPPPR